MNLFDYAKEEQRKEKEKPMEMALEQLNVIVKEDRLRPTAEAVSIKLVDDLIELAKKELDFNQQVYWSFNDRIKRVGGRAYIKQNRIEIGSNLSVKRLNDVIRHEVAHLKTKAGDKDKMFINFCNKHNIPLKLDTEDVINNFKYMIKCTCCDWENGRVKKSKVIKGIEATPDNYKCPKCKNKLKVEYLKGTKKASAGDIKEYSRRSKNPYKYEMVCKGCNQTIGRYMRKSKYIKLILSGNNHSLRCGKCNCDDLKVKKL